MYIYRFLLTSLFSILILSSLSQAENGYPKRNLYLSVGKTVIDSPEYFKYQYDNQFQFSFAYGSKVKKDFEILVNLNLQRYNYDNHNADSVSGGDITQILLGGFVKYIVPISREKSSFYIKGGLGIAYIIQSDLTIELGNTDYVQEYENRSSLFLQANAGLQIKSVFIEIGYLRISKNEERIVYDYPNNTVESVSGSYFPFSIGIRF